MSDLSLCGCVCVFAVSHERLVGLKRLRKLWIWGGGWRMVKRGIKGREAMEENEKTLSPFTRFRITKKSRGGCRKEGEVV